MGNVIETLGRIVKGTWGDGASKGLMSSFEEIGGNVVSGKERSAAQSVIYDLKRNGAKFNEEGLSEFMKTKESGLMNRDEVLENIQGHISDDTRTKALNASSKKISAYQAGGNKISQYMESGATVEAAEAYLGRKEGTGLGGMNIVAGYFGDAEHGMHRVKTAAAGTAVGAVGARYLQGGNMTTNANGEKDIAGIPFF